MPERVDVGVCGRRRPTSAQIKTLAAELRTLRKTLARHHRGDGDVRLHHGDCVGSDAAAHVLGVALGYVTVGHPPDDDTWRAFCDCDKLRDPKPYLDRDEDVAAESLRLWALVASPREQRRGSGTWATIRRARKHGRPVTLILPDGSTREDRP